MPTSTHGVSSAASPSLQAAISPSTHTTCLQPQQPAHLLSRLCFVYCTHLCLFLKPHQISLFSDEFQECKHRLKSQLLQPPHRAWGLSLCPASCTASAPGGVSTRTPLHREPHKHLQSSLQSKRRTDASIHTPYWLCTSSTRLSFSPAIHSPSAQGAPCSAVQKARLPPALGGHCWVRLVSTDTNNH